MVRDGPKALHALFGNNRFGPLAYNVPDGIGIVVKKAAKKIVFQRIVWAVRMLDCRDMLSGQKEEFGGQHLFPVFCPFFQNLAKGEGIDIHNMGIDVFPDTRQNNKAVHDHNTDGKKGRMPGDFFGGVYLSKGMQ